MAGDVPSRPAGKFAVLFDRLPPPRPDMTRERRMNSDAASECPLLFTSGLRSKPCSSMAHSAKIRGMKEEGCLHFAKKIIFGHVRGQRGMLQVIEVT